MPKLTVAIIGAGLGGLFFAIALQKYAPDVDFVIYEGASQLADIGAGVALHLRAWFFVRALGLEQDLLKLIGGEASSSVYLIYRKSDQNAGVDFSERRLVSYTFHRAELQRVLLEHLKAHVVHLSKRLVAYTDSVDPNTPIELHFQDSTTATCDILVGCDGIRSAVRIAMYTQLAEDANSSGNPAEAVELRAHITPRFSGSIIYKSTISKTVLSEKDAERPAFNTPSMVVRCGKNGQLVTYPISRGRMINVGAFVTISGQDRTKYEGSWSALVSNEELVQHFSTWEEDAQQILKHVKCANKWAVHVVNKLPTYAHGRVALLGDAAHAMLPHLGSGAAQGIEDAFTLARFLAHSAINDRNVTVALRVYDEVRRPMSQHIAAVSKLSGELNQFNRPKFFKPTLEEGATVGTAIMLEQLHEMAREMDRYRKELRIFSVEQDHKLVLRRLDEVLNTMTS